MADGPLIVQSDRTVLLEVAHPRCGRGPARLAVFAELERAPEHMHTYRITRLGLWNARAAGHNAEDMLATLDGYAKFPVPQSVSDRHPRDRRRATAGSSSSATRGRRPAHAAHRTDPAGARRDLAAPSASAAPGRAPSAEWTLVRRAWARGQLKQELLKLGWPAEDRAGYTPGTPHPIELDRGRAGACAPTSAGGRQLLRRAARASWCSPAARARRSSAPGAMASAKTTTLILVTNTVSRPASGGTSCSSARRSPRRRSASTPGR